MPKTKASTPSKPHGTKRAAKKPTLAQKADRHDLYQRAVQCVEAEVDFVDATFKSIRKRTPTRLREDFCGTANTCCEWVRRRPANLAIGLDLDQPTLDWGIAHNLSRLKPAQRERVSLRQTDVLVEHPDLKGTLDVVLAMNFSYWIFKDRATLLRYFKRVREDLTSDGIFFLDFYGGFDAHRELKERRAIPHATKAEPSVMGFNSPFTYVWDQHAFNPISGDMLCKIHFHMPDGSKLRDAFTYDWRLWTIPEIRELLSEAGFKKSTIYWEGDDENNPNEGNGEFTPSEQGEACASWICYLTAEK